MDMFSQEVNGYNRNEVDSYIQRLKVSYEAKLMEEKLKALDSEKRILDLKNERSEIENKEKNILNALSVFERAKKFEEEGSKNLNKLIMDKVEYLVNELNNRFPQLRTDQNFEDILSEFSSIMKRFKKNIDDNKSDINRPIFSDNDSMRMLLNKMQDYKKVQDSPKEVHITTTRNLFDYPKSESGFSFEEALNPKEDLSEIMKAFDFYNEN